MPPLSKCLPFISPAEAMVIDFGVKNRVVAMWKSLSKASVQNARNGPSTQLIKATVCVERSNATMKVEELSQLSSYQMLTTDKNRRSYQYPKKLVKNLAVITANSVKLLRILTIIAHDFIDQGHLQLLAARYLQEINVFC